MITRKDIDSINSYSRKLAVIKKPLLNYTVSKIFDLNSAQDIVQDVLLILSAKENQFDENKSFYSWAFKICNFQIKKHLTMRKRNREDSSENIWRIAEQSYDLDPAQLFSEKEDKSELNKIIDFLLDNLSPQQKQVMECIMNGMSRKDARSIMNLQEGHFNLAYHRTIKSCQRILKNERKKESLSIK